MIHARVTHEPISSAELLERVGASEDGAVLLFLGVVRNHADDRPVASLEYEGYVAMAEPVLADITREAAALLATDRVAVEHRIGALAIGDVSVAIAVSSPHRAESYEASRYIIEQIKRRLPIWKQEGYLDGTRQWVPGQEIEGASS